MKNQKIKIKRLWLRLWDPSEIHRPLIGSPGPRSMYQLNLVPTEPPSHRPWYWYWVARNNHLYMYCPLKGVSADIDNYWSNLKLVFRRPRSYGHDDSMTSRTIANSDHDKLQRVIFFNYILPHSFLLVFCTFTACEVECTILQHLSVFCLSNA